jgi:hypothetical protein
LVGKATTDTLTNKTLTGAAMNGTVGATTPSTGAFTTLTSTSASSFATSSGNVGIGTSSPSVKLHASTSGAGIQEVEWLNNSQAVGADVGSAMVFTGTSSNNGLARISGAFAGATTADGAYMAFSTRAVTTGALTERARFNSTGALVFAGGTTGADGIGITFPATQSASTDANTLDDYEEGTYGSSSANGILTPSTSGSITCASDFSCSYTKIGRQVVCQGLITVSSVSSPVGFIKIALPFAQLSALNALGFGTFSSYNIDLPAGAVSNGLTSQTGGVTFCWPRVSVDNAPYANVDSALLIVGSQIQFTFSFITS